MKNKLLKLFQLHGYNKLFELTLSVGEASEILLQQHSNNRQLDESVIGLWTFIIIINSGNYLGEPGLLIINPNDFVLIEGAHKLAGFIESDLKEITLQAVFSEKNL